MNPLPLGELQQFVLDSSFPLAKEPWKLLGLILMGAACGSSSLCVSATAFNGKERLHDSITKSDSLKNKNKKTLQPQNVIDVVLFASRKQLLFWFSSVTYHFVVSFPTFSPRNHRGIKHNILKIFQLFVLFLIQEKNHAKIAIVYLGLK